MSEFKSDNSSHLGTKPDIEGFSSDYEAIAPKMQFFIHLS